MKEIVEKTKVKKKRFPRNITIGDTKLLKDH